MYNLNNIESLIYFKENENVFRVSYFFYYKFHRSFLYLELDFEEGKILHHFIKIVPSKNENAVLKIEKTEKTLIFSTDQYFVIH